MRILVAVKPVAVIEDDAEIKLRKDNRGVDPDSLGYYLNEWDDYSLGEAVKVKEASQGEVEIVAVSIAGGYAEDTLRQCLAKGADRAIRIWDETLEYPSPLTLAKIIAKVAQRETPDMLFAGVQSNDQVFAATGIAAAAYLGWPHSAAISKIEWAPGENTAILTRALEGGFSEKLEIQCPAVLSIQSGINALRYPSLRDIKQAKTKPLDVLSLADLDLENGELSEAEFNIRSMYVPDKTAAAEFIEGNLEEQSARIIEIIKEVKGA